VSTRASRLAWLALLPLLLFAAAFAAFTADALPLLVTLPWIPGFGIDLTLHVDGWALQFILLITGVGTFVFIYAGGYMAGEPRRLRLFVLLIAFMVSMLGCVATDNLIALFVFWELTSLTSFLLVGYKHEDAPTRASAQQALMVTGGGGLVLLAGLILLGHIGGTYSLLELMRFAAVWNDDPLVPLALILIFIGAFTKSAQFPFHFWLPNAMTAPTPVSAYLHSATMVKLGIYLLGRLHPAFGDMALWQVVLISVGGFNVRAGDAADAPRARSEAHSGVVDGGGTWHAGDADRRARRWRRHRHRGVPAGTRALQGAAVFRRRQHRSRNGHAQHRQPVGPCARDAVHRCGGAGGGGVDGRHAVVIRLSSRKI
jgi:NADH:ubiquinone oxidoreductase subunit 5 (subunit L)/multisubunit Na+/H+ antiporter MnhA subunit